MDADGENEEEMGNVSGVITEEEREERRRIWWLVYVVDRHLALCYNRPLFLLDIECYDRCTQKMALCPGGFVGH